jgi:hypothetical protein
MRGIIGLVLLVAALTGSLSFPPSLAYGAAPLFPGAPVASHAVTLAPTHAATPARTHPEAATPSSQAAGPHTLPANLCRENNPQYTIDYDTNGNGFAPPLPSNYPGVQYPCTLADPTTCLGCYGFHDEVHSTFSSNAPGSGSRVTFPITLPVDHNITIAGSTYPGLATVIQDYSIGIIATGDVLSVYNQTFVQVYFVPNESAGNGYDIVLSAWSLHINLAGPASCNVMWLTWNDTYACEWEDMGGGKGLLLATTVPGGEPINVTFLGSASGDSPMNVYVNDSSDSLAREVTLDNSTTGVGNLHPAFNASCLDYCVLNWSTPPFTFGMGFGADLCYGACDSYSENYTNMTLQPAVGAPLFYSDGKYQGQYPVLGMSSDSGACSGQPNVIICPPLAVDQEYLQFSFNGSALNFGTWRPWDTENWGGAQREFPISGAMNDSLPFWVDRLGDNSRDGFVASSTSINVTARAQVLGTVQNVFLNYTLPDGTTGNVSMVRVNGTGSSGYYNGTIPATGGDGTITYRLYSFDVAGTMVTSPEARQAPHAVLRGPLPTFEVKVEINIPGCGEVWINGTPYLSGATASLEPGYYPVHAQLCYPYVFQQWSATRGLVVGSGPVGTLAVSANGTLEGYWQYVRPHDSVTLNFDPVGCGTTLLNGTAYSQAQTVYLLNWWNFTLNQTPCGLHSFAGWTVSNGSALRVMGYTLTVVGNGTLTANYILSAGAVTVLFHTLPGSCNGILFRGAGVVDNETLGLASGIPYPIAQDPCAHYGFRQFNTTAGLTISGGTLTAMQAGIVTEVDYELTEVAVSTLPSWCGGIVWNGTFYAGGVLLNLTNNSGYSLYPSPCTGYYFTGFFATGGISILGNRAIVNGSGTLQANYQKGTPSAWVGFLTSPPGCGYIVFNGFNYVNSNWTNASPLTQYTVSAVACPGWGFVGWRTTGGITILGDIAYVNSSGSIEAIFHPVVQLLIYTTPASCGAVVLAGVSYANGASVQVPIQSTLTLSATPCPGYRFSAWHNTSTAFLYTGSVVFIGPSILTAVFVPLKYSVGFLVQPANCGGITFNGIEYFNGSVILALGGAYQVGSVVCAGNMFLGWNVSGAVHLNGSTLLINGTGTVEVRFGPVPPTLTAAAPASSFTNALIQFSATVGVVLTGPQLYNYTWSFGDGSSVTTPVNFTSHSYSAPGTYTVHVTVVDPYGRRAEANVTVLVTVPSLSSSSFTLLDGAVVGLVIVVIAAVTLLARRRPPTGEAAGLGAGPSAGAISGEGEGSIPLPPTESENPALPLEAPSGGPSNPEETP